MTTHKPIRLPLWPSHAHRWINCPGQPRVAYAAMQALGDRQSPYAAEGTAAHAYLEARLTGKPLPRIIHLPDPSGDITDREYDKLEESNAEQIAILEKVADDIEFIRDINGFEMLCEQSFEYRIGRHVARCKIDILMHNADRILIIDYKHGMGKLVDPQGNPQMMLYALAASSKYPGLPVTVGIYQPRGRGEGLVEVKVSADELNAWQATFEAASFKCYAHMAEYVIGPWCNGCPGMYGICPQILNELVCACSELPQPGSVNILTDLAEIRNREEKARTDKTKSQKHQLTEAEIRMNAETRKRIPIEMPWWLLDVAPVLQETLRTVCGEADNELKERRQVPGWELLQGNGKRQWLNPDEVPAVLAQKLGGTEEDYQNVKVTPIGITEAERLAKQRKATLDGMTIAPPSYKRRRTDGPDWAWDEDEQTGFDSFE